MKSGAQLLVLAFCAVAGCGSSSTNGNPDALAQHVGRTCQGIDPPAADGGGAPVAVVDVGLECPSRICALPAKEVTTDTSFLCTIDCAADSDCAVAEVRDTSNNADRRCRGGFSCRIASASGDFCCRKLCLCNDFFAAGPAPAIPAACTSTPENQANCKNIR